MLKDTIQTEMQKSLKEGKATKLKVLRYVLSLLKYEEINTRKDLTDDQAVLLLQKEVKKRKEAIELFKKGKRDDLVKDEEAQIKAIEKYLPKEMDDKDLNRIIDGIFTSLKPPFEIGLVMKIVMSHVKGKADGSKVSVIVREKIASAK